ncbi:MAG: S8 family serine peptidase, partial [Candidatus Diapherotrites archaeon]|nr:S8 family serine peptidase [Candidatus Diapherotrites archaeon]
KEYTISKEPDVNSELQVLYKDTAGNKFNSVEDIIDLEKQNFSERAANVKLKLDEFVLKKFEQNPGSSELIEVVVFLKDQPAGEISSKLSDALVEQIGEKKDAIDEITKDIDPEKAKDLEKSGKENSASELDSAEKMDLEQKQKEISDLKDDFKETIVAETKLEIANSNDSLKQFISEIQGKVISENDLTNFLVVELPISNLPLLADRKEVSTISTTDEIFSIPPNSGIGSFTSQFQYTFVNFFRLLVELPITGFTSLLNILNKEDSQDIIDKIISPLEEEFDPLLTTSVQSTKVKTWWDANLTGGEADVGTVDTGVDINHPAIRVNSSGIQRVFDQIDLSGDKNVDDLHLHGTHVTGIIAGSDLQYRGIAHGIKHIINAKFLNRYGSGEFGAGMSAMDWAVTKVTNSADVLNSSWGCSSCFSNGESSMTRFVDALTDTFKVVLVFAAGNGTFNKTINTPGDGYNVITVGSMDDRGTANRSDDLISSFSSRGATADGRKKPDLVAPGSGITSADAFWELGNLWRTLSGTSMATPHVTGASAILTDLGLSPKEV